MRSTKNTFAKNEVAYLAHSQLLGYGRLGAGVGSDSGLGLGRFKNDGALPTR